MMTEKYVMMETMLAAMVALKVALKLKIPGHARKLELARNIVETVFTNLNILKSAMMEIMMTEMDVLLDV